MARLKMAPHRLRILQPRIARSEPVAQQQVEAAWRKWYKTAKWQRLRWSVLVDDLFTCRRCKRVEVDTAQLVADHIIPHRGDDVMFWDRANLQCLCKPCHDKVKQSEEKRGIW